MHRVAGHPMKCIKVQEASMDFLLAICKVNHDTSMSKIFFSFLIDEPENPINLMLILI